MAKDYVFCFTNNHQEFRMHELISVMDLFGIECDIALNSTAKSRFIKLTLKSVDLVKSIASRCVLLKFVIELWGEGGNICQMNEVLQGKLSEYSHYFSKDQTFRFDHYTFGHKMKHRDTLERFEELSYIPFEGRICLKDPDEIYSIVEDYEYYDNEGGLLSPPGTSAPILKKIYFGRLISDGQTTLPHRFNLEKRYFIGNTSMDPGLALIMANLAKITNNSICIDPFAGTGSILIAAAAFGAKCIGTEINYMVVHGKGKPSRAKVKHRSPNECVFANFEQYGFQDKYLDIVLADASQPDMWKCRQLFDAILCDPPYGIREKCSKLGPISCRKEQDPDSPAPSFPQKRAYSPILVFLDLLDFAAEYLVAGGRLVYWYPVKTDGFTIDMLPQHPALILIANCEQKLSSNHSRRLITMEKSGNIDLLNSKAYVLTNPYDVFSMRDLVLGKNHMKEI